MSTRVLVAANEEEPALPAPPGRQRRILAGAAVAALGLAAAGCVLLARGRGQPSVTGQGLEEVTELAIDPKTFCKTFPYLRYEIPGAVLHNNLGKKGPELGTEEGLVFRTKAVGGGAGAEYGKEVLMVVNATNADYQPAYPKVLGRQGKYGSVNIKPGTHLDMEFTFFDRSTMQQLTMKDFALTLFDLDTGRAGASKEYVELQGFEEYHLTQNTEVKVSKVGHRTRFAASTEGDGADNPLDPMFLTDQQKNRAVTLLYQHIKKVHVRVGAEPGATARFFTFVSRPSLLCAVTVQEGFKPPLADLIYHEPMQTPVKAQAKAEFVAWKISVGQQVKKGQPIAVSQVPGQPAHTHLAPCDGTVMAMQEQLKPHDKFDLRLDDKALCVIQRPYLTPLTRSGGASGGGSGSAATGGTPGQTILGGGPGNVPGIDKDTFVKYWVKPGDGVKPGQPIALVKDAQGNERNLTATAWGNVVARQESMRSGDPMAAVKDHQFITVGKFAPLPKTAAQGSAELSQVKSPLHFEFDSKSNSASPASLSKVTFVEYLVKPGDIVKAGDPIATLKDKDGKLHTVVSPQPGVVRNIQTGLKPGMPLGQVMSDDNLATIGPLPPLNTSSSKQGAFAPTTGQWKFERWKVNVGDNVKTNDTVAVLQQVTDGSPKSVASRKSGTVVERQENLQPGDIVERVTFDEDLVTVGKIKSPDIGFRQVGVNAKMDDVFDKWMIKKGQRVHFGDPIAQVTRNAPPSSGGRRLSGPQNIKIPSPGTGTVDYVADLKPGESIRDQSVGPTIARVDMGPPWWLLLLAALLCLCCCFCCLFKVMRKPRPIYRPMPPVETTPDPPAPPEPAPKPEPTPEGLRLDFNDAGTIRTVYAKYRPLGIKHNYVAPIVAHDFTINSYAKQELGVKDGWKLTRIGDEELNDSSDFDAVNAKLSRHVRNFPLWPLPLEFRKSTGDSDRHVLEFVEKPIGLEFANVAPIQVGKVYDGSPAAREGVQAGWFLTRIGEYDVHENRNFRDVMMYFKEGVKPLNESGRNYSTYF